MVTCKSATGQQRCCVCRVFRSILTCECDVRVKSLAKAFWGYLCMHGHWLKKQPPLNMCFGFNTLGSLLNSLSKLFASKRHILPVCWLMNYWPVQSLALPKNAHVLDQWAIFSDNFAFLQHFPDIPKLFPPPHPPPTLQIVKLAAENISWRTLPISWRQNTTLCQGGGRVQCLMF